MSEVDVLIDLYDHEILKIEDVVRALNSSAGKVRVVEGFRKEAIERFEEIGLVASVLTYATNVDGAYMFDIQISGRCEKLAHGFDHDMQMAEVQSNILGLDQTPGAMQRDGTIKSPAHHTLITKKD